MIDYQSQVTCFNYTYSDRKLDFTENKLLTFGLMVDDPAQYF